MEDQNTSASWEPSNHYDKLSANLHDHAIADYGLYNFFLPAPCYGLVEVKLLVTRDAVTIADCCQELSKLSASQAAHSLGGTFDNGSTQTSQEAAIPFNLQT
jgi:hypothetical protein